MDTSWPPRDLFGSFPQLLISQKWQDRSEQRRHENYERKFARRRTPSPAGSDRSFPCVAMILARQVPPSPPATSWREVSHAMAESKQRKINHRIET